jgi:putative oxygen-independent coproporphyrinogen III oxidase
MEAEESPSTQSGIGIYVHFPWCLKKCPYCDFLSIAVPEAAPGVTANAAQARAQLPHRAYADAVLRELERRVARLPRPLPPATSVFFGGGTPSLWEPEELGRVLAAIGRTLDVPSDLEVTVECNPTSVNEKHFDRLLRAGVNRVSIGVQAVDQERLSFLGRLHDPAGGLEALRTARRAGVPRVSGDLIFGVYKQSPTDAVRDVQQVLDTGVDHLSAYALTIEENTRFGALHRTGHLPLLEEELVAQSFEAVENTLATAGFEHYEVSNYARPGERSRHNVGYWRGRDYLGLGTGAVGTVTLASGRLRYKNLLAAERYLAAFSPEKDGTFDPFSEQLTEREALDGETSLREGLMLGLRIREGIDTAELERQTGAAFWTAARERSASRLVGRGLLHRDGARLAIPHAHWLLADGIVRELL